MDLSLPWACPHHSIWGASDRCRVRWRVATRLGPQVVTWKVLIWAFTSVPTFSSSLRVPQSFLGTLCPNFSLLFPQRHSTGTYLNMPWSEFFSRTGVR